eukprot:g10181.t1
MTIWLWVITIRASRVRWQMRRTSIVTSAWDCSQNRSPPTFSKVVVVETQGRRLQTKFSMAQARGLAAQPADLSQTQCEYVCEEIPFEGQVLGGLTVLDIVKKVAARANMARRELGEEQETDAVFTQLPRAVEARGAAVLGRGVHADDSVSKIDAEDSTTGQAEFQVAGEIVKASPSLAAATVSQRLVVTDVMGNKVRLSRNRRLMDLLPNKFKFASKITVGLRFEAAPCIDVDLFTFGNPMPIRSTEELRSLMRSSSTTLTLFANFRRAFGGGSLLLSGGRGDHDGNAAAAAFGGDVSGAESSVFKFSDAWIPYLGEGRFLGGQDTATASGKSEAYSQLLCALYCLQNSMPRISPYIKVENLSAVLRAVLDNWEPAANSLFLLLTKKGKQLQPANIAALSAGLVYVVQAARGRKLDAVGLAQPGGFGELLRALGETSSKPGEQGQGEGQLSIGHDGGGPGPLRGREEIEVADIGQVKQVLSGLIWTLEILSENRKGELLPVDRFEDQQTKSGLLCKSTLLGTENSVAAADAQRIVDTTVGQCNGLSSSTPGDSAAASSSSSSSSATAAEILLEFFADVCVNQSRLLPAGITSGRAQVDTCARKSKLCHSVFQVTSARAVFQSVHPRGMLTHDLAGKIVPCCGKPSKGGAGLVLFDPLSGKETSAEVAQLTAANTVRRGETSDRVDQLDDVDLKEGIVCVVDCSRSMQETSGFGSSGPDPVADAYAAKRENGWDLDAPSDPSPGRLQRELTAFAKHPNLFDFRAVIQRAPDKRATAEKILQELCVLTYQMRRDGGAEDRRRLYSRNKESFLRVLLWASRGEVTPVLCGENAAAQRGTAEHQEEEPLFDDDEVPHMFMCPITHEILEDPVIAADGFTYSRGAIEKWLEGSRKKSPMTGEKLSSKTLRANKTIKAGLLDWKEKHGPGERGQDGVRGGSASSSAALGSSSAGGSASERTLLDVTYDPDRFNENGINDEELVMDIRGVTGDMPVQAVLLRLWCQAIHRSGEHDLRNSDVVRPSQLDLWLMGSSDEEAVDEGDGKFVSYGARGAPDKLMKGMTFAERPDFSWKPIWRLGGSSRDDEVPTISGFSTGKRQERSWEKRDLTRMEAVAQFFNAFCNRSIAYNYPTAVGLSSFGSDVTEAEDIELTPAYEHFRQDVNELEPSGDTYLYDALQQAAEALLEWRNSVEAKQAASAQETGGSDSGRVPPRMRIICLSDGKDTDSVELPHEVANYLQQHRIVLDLITIGPDEDPNARAIAKASGGYVFRPKSLQQGLQIMELEPLLYSGERPANFEWTHRRGLSLVKDAATLTPFTNLTRFPIDRCDGSVVPPIRKPEELEQLEGGALKIFNTKGLIQGDLGKSSASADKMVIGADPSAASPARTTTSNKRKNGAPPAAIKKSTNNASSSTANPQQHLSRELQRRLTLEIHGFARRSAQRNPNIDIYPAESLSFWKVVMIGPDSTPYEHGVFQLYVKFPPSYPVAGPEVRFSTPVKHCNVNAYGKICHRVLGNDWHSDRTAVEVLNCVYGLFMHPEVDDPIDSALALQWKTDRENYEKLIKDFVREHATSPTREEIREKFSCGEVGEELAGGGSVVAASKK